VSKEEQSKLNWPKKWESLLLCIFPESQNKVKRKTVKGNEIGNNERSKKCQLSK
jgi:hypothetical protein